MNELPGIEFPEPASHPLLVREEPRWKPALIATAILDLTGLALLYYAYTLGTLQELAVGSSGPQQWVTRVLLGAAVTQVSAVPIAQRTRMPWVIPAWAVSFVVGALLLAAFAFMGVSSIESVIK